MRGDNKVQMAAARVREHKGIAMQSVFAAAQADEEIAEKTRGVARSYLEHIGKKDEFIAAHRNSELLDRSLEAFGNEVKKMPPSGNRVAAMLKRSHLEKLADKAIETARGTSR